jgi:streptogramin lyase
MTDPIDLSRRGGVAVLSFMVASLLLLGPQARAASRYREFFTSGITYPYGLTTGPDGNIWSTENAGNNIGRITPAGVITEFPLPTTHSGPSGITAYRWPTEHEAALSINRVANRPISAVGHVC